MEWLLLKSCGFVSSSEKASIGKLNDAAVEAGEGNEWWDEVSRGLCRPGQQDTRDC